MNKWIRNKNRKEEKIEKKNDFLCLGWNNIMMLHAGGKPLLDIHDI